MNKTILACCGLLLISTAAMAESNYCTNAIIGWKNSHSFKLNIREIKQEEPLSLSLSSELVIKAIKSKCTEEEIGLRLEDSLCSLVIPGNINSEVCYLESKVGYFFVTRDMMGSAFITWNRWD
jgi:hypothetical protein